MKTADVFCFAIALLILTQDYMGKEAWLAHIEENWIDAKYSVPMALFLIVVTCVRIYLQKPKGEK